jgi:hypothetical protein
VFGRHFDIITDDGLGRIPSRETVPFESLWQFIVPGGFYIIHNLQLSSGTSKEGMMRAILGWADQLAHCKKRRDKGWVKWPSMAPSDLLSVHCQEGSCAMRKKFRRIDSTEGGYSMSK